VNDDQNPRRPGRVIILVLGFWIVGGTLQSMFGWLLANSGMFDVSNAVLIGQVLAWGLLFVASYAYRRELDIWLRS
jgi:hypothetical protein